MIYYANVANEQARVQFLRLCVVWFAFIISLTEHGFFYSL